MMEDSGEGPEGDRPADNRGFSTPPPGGVSLEDVARELVDKETKTTDDGDDDDVAMATGDKASTDADHEKTEQTTMKDEVATEMKNPKNVRKCDDETAKTTSTGRGLVRIFVRRRNKQDKEAKNKESRKESRSEKKIKKQEERMKKHSKIVVCIFACCCVQPSE
ncbi:uncharacterized protein LOC119744658 [Patiria miniata]|uniref:Uncharacterized protein n=1 Tax=Patiria miniata TaxID=46514 RepID=A0A914BKK9_PATMI|nr:uncharacterized protein LOC119744658 [Patiria miniata]